MMLACAVAFRAETATHVDEVLVSAANYVVVGDCNGVNAAPGGLEDMDALQRTNVPNLKARQREKENNRKIAWCRNGHSGAVRCLLFSV